MTVEYNGFGLMFARSKKKKWVASSSAFDSVNSLNRVKEIVLQSYSQRMIDAKNHKDKLMGVCFFVIEKAVVLSNISNVKYCVVFSGNCGTHEYMKSAIKRIYGIDSTSLRDARFIKV